MAVYGLTGGIGAGKSTVCRMLQELDITVLSAHCRCDAAAAVGTA